MQNINGNKKFQSELNLRLKSTHFDKKTEISLQVLLCI